MQIILNNDKKQSPMIQETPDHVWFEDCPYILCYEVCFALLTEHMQPGTTENMMAVVSRLRNQAASEVML